MLIIHYHYGRLFPMAPTATIAEWKQVQEPTEDPSNTVYELSLQRGAYKLAATVGITPQYPVRAPTIDLTFALHPSPKPHSVVPGVKVDPTAARLAGVGVEGVANNNLEAIAEEVNVHLDD